MEDLDDVVLNQRVRISDDPNDWILPKSLVDSGDLLSWWTELAAQDDALWASGLNRNVRETLLWLASEYVALRSETAQDNHQNIPQHLSKIRTVVRQVCHLGLTTEQTARLLGETRATVLRSLFFNKPIPDAELPIRYQCEAMLRNRVPQKKIVADLPMSVEEVRALAKMLGIDRVVTSDGFGDDIRNEAVALRRDGLTNGQIATQLSDKYGKQIRPATVSQWWFRANRGAA